MDTQTLRRLGLTAGEAKVYLALIGTGDATSGLIAKESQVSKSKVYDVLERLIGKGLVSYVIRGGVKRFAISDPRAIIGYLERKEAELAQTKAAAESILPALMSQRYSRQKGRKIEVYEGFAGMRTIRDELISSLKKGDEYLILGAPRIANEKWEGWLLSNHRRNEARGVRARILYNSDAREFGAKRSRFSLVKARYLPNKLVSPNWFDIFHDAVLITIILQEPVSIAIRDESLANSFRSYFELLWQMSDT